LSRCVKVDTLGRLCDNNLERVYNHFITTNIYFIGAAYNFYFLIIYKPSTLIISPWTFSTQLGAGIAWFCLSPCAIPFCTLSAGLLWSGRELTTKWGNNLGLSSCAVPRSAVVHMVAYFRRTELLPGVLERSGID